MTCYGAAPHIRDRPAVAHRSETLSPPELSVTRRSARVVSGIRISGRSVTPSGEILEVAVGGFSDAGQSVVDLVAEGLDALHPVAAGTRGLGKLQYR